MIFYDLETSDSLAVGQIINYSFIQVDERFEPCSECNGTVKLTRLQIPSPDAILANRVNVSQLQQEGDHVERDALLRIWDYLADIARESEEPVRLIGYNSSKFDLPFLRTSFIRNGLNPYFEGRVISGDLLHASRKLSITRKDFPRTPSRKGEPHILSLSLETLSRAFGLLDGPQAHESRADVLLTIQLAEIYARQFGISMDSYVSYEAPPTMKRGEVIGALSPQYELSQEDISCVTPYVFLDGDHRSALWLDLNRFHENKDRSSIVWMTKATSALYYEPKLPALTTKQEEVKVEALDKFRNLQIKNYFSRSSCDIEMDIYRLDFQAIDALREAIWERNPAKIATIKNSDLQALYDRHRISYYPWGAGHDEKVSALIREYARYRYGGKMPLFKGNLDSYEEGIYSSHYHETLGERVERVERLIEERIGREDEEGKTDCILLYALKDYILRSDIVRCGGDDLMRYVREKKVFG